MKKNISFLSGIQRSGSTLLTKVLNQHPMIFASNTSPLFDYLFFAVEKLEELKRTSSAAHYINSDAILQASIDGFYAFTDRSHVLDKHRAWATNYYNVHTQVLANPKMIVTLRPVEEVVTSFHTILQKNNTPASIATIYRDFIEEHVPTLIESAQYVDNFLVVTYQELTHMPTEAFCKIESYLELPAHKYEFDSIIDMDPENDTRWGIKDLHAVRSTISSQSISPDTVMTSAELKFFKKLTYRIYEAFNVCAF